MTTTTDLRAALRDAADTLDMYSEIGFVLERATVRAIATRLRTIADAPPTVAELLPLVDATHTEEWTATTGEKMRIRLDTGGQAPVYRVEYWNTAGTRWMTSILGPEDMNQPARLVEVSP